MQWLDQAACLHLDPELFFPVGPDGPGLEQTKIAKQVCRTCPVVTTCLEWAIASGIPFGVLGGLSEEERRALSRARSSVRDARAAPPGTRPDRRRVGRSRRLAPPE
jgi:WhiB family transcriptional regulator, redox-sensing transcriptional regulator